MEVRCTPPSPCRMRCAAENTSVAGTSTAMSPGSAALCAGCAGPCRAGGCWREEDSDTRGTDVEKREQRRGRQQAVVPITESERRIAATPRKAGRRIKVTARCARVGLSVALAKSEKAPTMGHDAHGHGSSAAAAAPGEVRFLFAYV